MNALARTDKERAQIAEARVAELEEELIAWRSYRPESFSSVAVPTTAHFEALIRSVIGSQHARGTRKFLCALAENGGRICGHEMLFERLGCAPQTGLNVTKVYAHKARCVLRALDLGDLIETIWGEGYSVSASGAAKLRGVIAGSERA